MDGTGTNEALGEQESADDDRMWAAVIPLPSGLVRRLEALAAEVGAMDPGAPNVGPVALGELGPH